MLTSDEVDLLCRVGKGTPMGEVYRRYWTPALPAEDLPRPGCPPVRVKVLGEELVAFRDSEGRVGVLDEFCSHRGASLAIAMVEDCGLRCIYHGWKFDADGRILDTPNMPVESKFKDLNRHLSYPVREAGGLIWVYMGPPDEEPPFPHFWWFDTSPDGLYVRESILRCNYLQVQEGSIDSSHVGVLHHKMHAEPPEPDERVAGADGVVRFGGWRGETPADGSPTDNVPSVDMAPVFEVETTAFGFHYAALRESIYGPERRYVRVTAFAFPYIAFIPPSSTPAITVPADDYTTISFGVFPKSTDPAGGLNQARVGQRGFPPLAPRGERVVVVPPQDRKGMEEGRTFAGWEGIAMQDNAVQTSMGPMFDRHNEHLVSPADAAIVRFRRMLRDEARRVAAGERAGFAHAGYPMRAVLAGSGIVPDGEPWHALVPGNLSGEPAQV